MFQSEPTTLASTNRERSSRAASAVRGGGLLLTVVLVIGAQVAFARPALWSTGWWLSLAVLLAALTWQAGLAITDWKQPAGGLWGLAPGAWRRVTGALLVLVACVLWIDASIRLSASWGANFDRAWVTWFVAAALMSLGFRVLQRRRTPATDRLSRWEWAALVICFVVAVGFRLGNIENYPPHFGVSQIEELQGGQFGTRFLMGDRGKWEFYGPAVVHALGIWIGGPTLLATRSASAVLSLVRVVPAYFCFRALAGPAGAMVGTALLAVSGWDTIVSHCSGHPDPLITFLCLALLMGPAVRGAWAAYPWIGLLAGYSTTTYIAYRPLVGLAIAGVFIGSLARSRGSRLSRGLRALVPTAAVTCLVAAMFIPLFYRLPGPGQFAFEYLNGWNRARGVESYYGPRDTWSRSIEKRWQRTTRAANLYFTRGDENPVHNVGGRPLVDATTAGLMLLGIAYGLVGFLRGFYGLVLVVFAITFVGTLVVTGNLDVLRAQATTTYVYALAAIGAGGLATAAKSSFGRPGRIVMSLLLSLAVCWAGYWNGNFLQELWKSPATRRHYRSDLTYLSAWLGQNARGHRVLGLIPPTARPVFMTNDGSWLRGDEVEGEGALDVGTLLRKLGSEKGPVLLLIFSGNRIDELIAYFETVLPGVRLQLGPKDAAGVERLAYAIVDSPARWATSPAAADALCRGLRATFVLRRADGTVAGSFSRLVPFIDANSWPDEVVAAVEIAGAAVSWVEASWEGDFTLPTGGTHTFFPIAHGTPVSAKVDDIEMPGGQETTVALEPGRHHFSMHGRFRPRAGLLNAQFFGRGPAIGEERRIVPFYRFSSLDDECTARYASAP